MKNHTLPSRPLARHLGLLVSTLALASTAQATTFITNIELRALDGSTTPGGVAALNAPLTRSLVDASNSGLKGSAAVDLGVLRASAATPVWDGIPGGAYSYYQASATAGYNDTLTFTRPGGGFVPVSFTFAFDGNVADPSASSAHRAGLDLSITMSGAAGSIVGPSPRDRYFRDGEADPFYANWPKFPSCRTGAPEFGQAALICNQNNSFSFSSSGAKAGTATLTFAVLSGQPVNVWTEMKAWGYSDEFIPTRVSYDFSHTATLTSIQGLFPDTQISSALAGSLVSANGGVTYAPALAVAVPEPQTWATMIVGLLALGGWTRRRRGAGQR